MTKNTGSVDEVAARLEARAERKARESRLDNERRASDRARAGKLADALNAVQSGARPRVNGGDTLGTLQVVDPFDERMRTKVTSLCNDPIGHMHKRKAIDDVQLKAARAYQNAWESAMIGGARGVDHIKDKVDGGKLAEPDTDQRLKARAELARLHRALGETGSDLVGLVLGHNTPLAVVAQMWGRMEHHAYRALRHRFVECLNTIAVKKGYAPERPASGPRRERDDYDCLATYSNNPALHKAVRLARKP